MSSATKAADGSGNDREIVVGETDAGETYTFPVEEILTGRGFATGKSGAGKSNTASVIAEELLERGHPLLIVDVDGEYWGLKEEYEVLHAGAGEECDLQVGPEHAGKLAELALGQHVPIVLDVSDYVDPDEADELVLEVARELFRREKKERRPFLLLVEEIHEYIPQQGSPGEVGEMLIRVAKRGRKRGLGMIGASQRPASVDKDFITQADLLIWHRLTWENDVDVAEEVLGKESAGVISELDPGEAFVQADWSEQRVDRVQFRRKHTFDAGATPGLDDVDRPELQSIDEDLVGELEEISQRQERRQDRVDQLEAKLEEKDETIADLEAEIERQGELDYLLRTWPPTRPATYPEAEPIEQHERLLYRNDIDDRHQYRLEFPQSFKDDDSLGLEAQQQVAFRLTVHDGQLATAIELDPDADPKASNVGTVFQTAQGQDPDYSNLGLVFLKPFANGLGYINDRRAKLRMSAYPGRILVEHTGEYEAT